MIGRRVGAYRLDEEVGRGGMGVVYRAVRVDGEFDQTVAVKLIKRGMDTDSILRRFRRERQITAALSHPNIAYFYGGGSTDDGLPYFVMEFVVGMPLFQHCDVNRLVIRERLSIFRQICWAAQAAHELKIIHRDLKPSNIMVNDAGKPKLLDFGIAKVLDPELMSTDQEPTLTHLRVMTPEYASPEQIDGDNVDARSDIYSLGVVLYELLTGHRPYNFKRRSSDEIARVIREEDPANPSSSSTYDDLLSGGENGATLESVLASRRASLDVLRNELAGDLDKIILKALRKSPGERYSTASGLADDITNFLEDRPVVAERFASMRNISFPRVQSKTSLAVLPFTLLKTATEGPHGDDFLGIGMADALIARLSRVQRLVIRPTSSILPFAGSEPFDAGEKLGVRFLLDGTVRTSGDRIRVSVQLLDLRSKSAIWARVFDERTENTLGLEDLLSKQVVDAVMPELSVEERELLARRRTDVPQAYEAYMRGRYFWSKFRYDYLLRSAEAFKQAIELDERYVMPYIGLADFYIWSAIFGEIPSREGFESAISAIRKALEIDPGSAEAYAQLAYAVFFGDWNWKEAEGFVKRSIEINPNHGFAHECYSNFLVAQGRFEEGIAEIRRAEELDPVSPRAILMTAWTLYHTRHYTEAVNKARKGCAMQENFPQGLLHLGNCLTGAGEIEEAVSVLRRSSEMWGDSGMPRYMLCHARAAEGNIIAARQILDKMLKTAEQKYVKPYFIAMCFVAVGEIDKAFEWFEKAVDEGNEWMIWFGTEPKLDPIRSDPRYRRLLRRTNNPLAFLPGDRMSGEVETGEKQRSIAVLPFKLLGGHNPEADDEYLSLGLADAVTMRLSNVRRFLVRPTSSVLPFSGNAKDPFDAGRELGVEYVLDGMIRYFDGRIRVTTQLLDVEENSTKWAASFSESYADVLELEDSISEQVTKQLVPYLSGEERSQLAKRGTNSKEAHDAYLQGRYFWNQFTPDSFPRSIEAFRRAVLLDPNYALAHVGIADYYTWATIYGLISPKEGFPRVFESASRALELDNGLAEGHAAIGLYYSNQREWALAEERYRKSIELNPNYPLGHEWLSSIMVGTGRFSEGIKEIEFAESLDPLSLRPKVLSAWTIYQTRNYPKALAKAQEIFDLNPDFLQSHLQLGNILTEMGETANALEHCRRAAEMAEDSPLPIYNLCFALAEAGRTDEVNELIAKWEAQAKAAYVPPYFLGLSNIAAGNIDAAFEHLYHALEEQSAWALWFGTEPKLDGIRTDPRFNALLRATNNPIIEKLQNK